MAPATDPVLETVTVTVYSSSQRDGLPPGTIVLFDGREVMLAPLTGLTVALPMAKVVYERPKPNSYSTDSLK